MPLPTDTRWMRKEVDYVLAPGMFLQQDQLYSKIGHVSIQNGMYIAEVADAIVVTESMDERIKNYWIANGWEEMKR